MKSPLSCFLIGLVGTASLQSQPLTWTQRTVGFGPSSSVSAAAYGDGKYVILAKRFVTPAQSQAATSPDGITWSVVDLPTAPLLATGITYGGGLWLVSTERLDSDLTTSRNILTSPDGRNWTARTTGVGSLNKVDHLTVGAGNLFVAVGALNGGQNAVTSTDGITWTRVSVAGGSGTLTDLAAGNGAFVASGGAGTKVYTTNNGLAWASVDVVPLSEQVDRSAVTSVVFAGGEFLASVRVGLFGNTRLFSSPNGSAWTARATIAPITPSAGGAGQFGVLAIDANGAASSGNARVVLAGFADGLVNTVLTKVPYILTSSGPLSDWSVQQFGTGLNADNRMVFFANNLWLVGNNAGQLFTASDVPAPTGFAFLNNLSVRARAGSGSETLIVGVTIGGSPVSTAKSVLIRGIGPTLSTFGVTGVLADPVISILSGTTTITSNDDWDATSGIAATSAAVGAFALPVGSRDSALFGTGLGSGGYTVQLTGKAGATGNALVELYDTALAPSITATTTRFTNLSARTVGGTGADTLIVGFNVAGTGTRRLLLRAVGPGLAGFGVVGTMSDPKLELYSGQTKIGENDNWDSTATLAAQDSVGAFRLTAGSRDAVLVSNLSPGAYTVQVTGGTTGVVLVEAYEVP